ncbi:unnamed protein product [Adineta steineri]|uniref:TIR domain-containing protein n=1 Tax=Adineta steineri TaxID=433720 RepID=A0A815RWZ1_9BILA|nr:unnamed protein product [Adineta steineri]CAF1483042.1 unnamed protein product [Adineta steineri]
MSDNEEQNESIAQSNTNAYRNSDHRRVRRRYYQWPKRHHSVLRKRCILPRGNRRNIRSSRRQSTNLPPEIIHASTQTDITSETEQEMYPNDCSSISIESRENQSDPTESVNEQALTRPVTPATLPSSPISSQARFNFVTENPMKVAVSYAGETESRVTVISKLIHDKLSTPESPFPVFYAPNFQDELAGFNGMKKLLKIYRKASLVVVFLSTTYHTSPFCEEEWRTIRNRFIYAEKEEERKRLLFVKLTDYNAEELNLVSDDFYIDGLKMNDQQVADLIVSRWRKLEKPAIQ